MAVATERRRAHIVMPRDLVERVDALVGQRRRSQFVTEAVEEKLARQRLKDAIAAMDGALADVDIPGWETPKAVAEWVRALRRGDDDTSSPPESPAGSEWLARSIMAHPRVLRSERREEAKMAVATARRRAHVVMPKEIIEEVDRLVGPRKRSRFVQEAVAEKLQRLRRIRAYDDFAGSLADVDVPGWETSESTVEWVRAQRRGWTEPAAAAATES